MVHYASTDGAFAGSVKTAGGAPGGRSRVRYNARLETAPIRASVPAPCRLVLTPDRRLPDRGAGTEPLPSAAPTLRERAEDGVRWAAVLLGCAIPVSVAADNILAAFLVVCWIATGGVRAKAAAIRDNPVALGALLLFALHVVGTLYTVAPRGDVVESLTKSLRLLLIPALLPLLREQPWRNRGIAAFAGSMLVTLALSYLLWLELLPVSTWLKGTALDPVAFKAHITHNVFMAFTAYLLALAAVEATSRGLRTALFVASAAAAVNVLAMVPGRTGHIVLLVLFAHFLYVQLRGWGLALAGLLVGALVAAVTLAPDSMLHKRYTVADDEFQQWRAGVPAAPTSSVGQRMGFVHNTLDVIRENPVLGVGTGGFAEAYAAKARRTGEAPTRNPHNEFLLMTAQFGGVGLVLFVGLFAVQWWLAAQLPGRFERSAARGFVLTMVVASAITSTLVDHSEGFFFAYMSGLLFAGCAGLRRGAPVRMPARAGEVPAPRGQAVSAAKRVL